VTSEDAAAALLIALPVAFNVFFFALARMFSYPDILRSPTATVFERFGAGGVRLQLVWYGFMLTAVVFAPLAVLLGVVLAPSAGAVVPVATTIGVLAAVVQFLGLARWPFLVPALARVYADEATSDARREATAVVFEAFHRYLGVAVGEGLGYLFTGVWTILIAAAMLESTVFSWWLGVPGLAVGAALVFGSFEFIGRPGEHGWKPAGVIVPVAYTAWSLWLVAAGIVLLVD
jgi:hypothetical protein